MLKFFVLIVNSVFVSHKNKIAKLFSKPAITHHEKMHSFLFGMASSHNIIVYRPTCYKNAVGNANTPMGSNIAYFREKYGIEVNRLSKNITKLVSEPKLSTELLIVIQHLRDLLDIKSNACTLDHFSEEDIDMLIQEVATR